MPTLNQTDLTATETLGTVYRRAHPSGYGEQEWVYILNGEAVTAMAAGDVVIRKSASATREGVIATSATVYPRLRIMGVAQYDLPAGYYGWILKKGLGNVKIGTADVTANTLMTTGGDRDGSAIDYADGVTTRIAAFAYNLATVTTNNTTAQAYIDAGG